MFKTLSLPAVLRFGNIEVRSAERRVLVGGAQGVLGARAFDLLVVLLEHRDRTMSKSELLDLVWPGLVVEENNLQVQTSHLRKVFGATAIATIPGRGYRFTLQPDADDEAAPTPAVQMHAQAHPAPDPPLLIGRDVDLAALLAQVQSQMLVTVVGAGGMGKTRLAQAAASHLRTSLGDSVWWVELAALSDPALVASTVARAAGVQTDATHDVAGTIAATVGARPGLLVLDNCEHLSDAVASLVSELRARAAQLRILVTSRSRCASTVNTSIASDRSPFRSPTRSQPSTSAARWR